MGRLGILRRSASLWNDFYAMYRPMSLWLRQIGETFQELIRASTYRIKGVNV